MPLLQMIIILCVVGVLLWLVNTYIPPYRVKGQWQAQLKMDAKIKTIINAVVIIAVALWILRILGLIGSLSTIRVGVIDTGGGIRSLDVG